MVFAGKSLFCLLAGAALLSAQPLPPTLANIPYAESTNPRQFLDLYLPDGPGPYPLLIWIHGGGWREGSKEGAGPLARRLLARGIAVASINYRLSTQAKFPAQIQDIRTAIRFLRDNASQYRLDPDRFGAAGSSAGGHLALLAGASGHTVHWDTAGQLRTGTSAALQAVVSLYGPSDFLEMNPAQPPACPIVDRNLPTAAESQLLGCRIYECPERAREASPLTYLTPAAPPFLLLHGAHDCLVPSHQSRLVSESLARLGTPHIYRELPGASHGGPGFNLAPVTDLMDDFLVRTLAADRALPLAGAADGQFANAAPGQMLTFRVEHLAAEPAAAGGAPLPEELNGVSAIVESADGLRRAAGISWVATDAVSFVLPGDLPAGEARVTVMRAAEPVATSTIPVRPSAPALFPAEFGALLWTSHDGEARRDALSVIRPADAAEPLTLVLYGTGFPSRPERLSASLHDTELEVRSARPQGDVPGLDELNIVLPPGFPYRGLLTLAVSLDGAPLTPLVLRVE